MQGEQVTVSRAAPSEWMAAKHGEITDHGRNPKVDVRRRRGAALHCLLKQLPVELGSDGFDVFCLRFAEQIARTAQIKIVPADRKTGSVPIQLCRVLQALPGCCWQCRVGIGQ